MKVEPRHSWNTHLLPQTPYCAVFCEKRLCESRPFSWEAATAPASRHSSEARSKWPEIRIKTRSLLHDPAAAVRLCRSVRSKPLKRRNRLEVALHVCECVHITACHPNVGVPQAAPSSPPSVRTGGADPQCPHCWPSRHTHAQKKLQIW